MVGCHSGLDLAWLAIATQTAETGCVEELRGMGFEAETARTAFFDYAVDDAIEQRTLATGHCLMLRRVETTACGGTVG